MNYSLSLDALRVLDAIDRKGTFAGAAAELYRVPSAITYAVAKLEDDLGVTLFDRSGPRPALTAVGRTVVAEGRGLLEGAAALAERARRQATGWESRVAIAVDTAVPVESVLPMVGALSATAADVEVALSCESLGGVWDALVDGRADLAVGAVADVCPPGRFVTRTLGMVEHVMTASPAHPLASLGRAADEDDLRECRLVVIADSTRNLPARTIGLGEARRRLVVGTMRDKRAAIAAGLGVGHLPVMWARHGLAAGTLVAVEVVEPPPIVEWLLAWRRGSAGRALRWLARAVHNDFDAARLEP